jgi:hypothetical protein
VADSEVVPAYQWIEYLKRSNMKKIFKIFFSVDQILPRASPTGLGKYFTYWKPIEPGPKRFATSKMGEVGGSSLCGGVSGGGSGTASVMGVGLGVLVRSLGLRRFWVILV